tara:strand:+ start:90 stop:548 length:459 start_codon:yes stop_codon:yes gene_type:complete
MANSSKMGAPKKYNKKYNEQARKLCLMGYTDVELADFFEVSVRTINNWKKEYPDFLHALKLGKSYADAEVTASLYERAVGYSHTETKVFNNQGEILTHDVKRIYPPDPISIKYWLNNRQPEKWREKVEIEHGGDTDGIIQKVQIEVVSASKD